MAGLSDEDRENLTAYLDGELDDEASRTLEAKIQLDPEAREEFEAMKRTWAMLDFLPKANPSSDFTNRTLDRLSVEKVLSQTTKKLPAYRRSWWVASGWAAAILVALGAGFGGFALYNRLYPTDPDEAIVRNLHLIEKLRLYDAVDDIELARILATPEFFGEDPDS